MTHKERLAEIERKWTLSKGDYTDWKYLLTRVKTLTEALEIIEKNTGHATLCKTKQELIDCEHYCDIRICARKALSEDG